MTKLILIDPTAKTIEFVERKEMTIEALYDIVECQYLEGLTMAPELTLMYDEEAKLHGKALDSFFVQDQLQILGKGILCRNNKEGDNIDATDADLEFAKVAFSF